MELSEQPLAVKMLYNSGSMWPSVVVHAHWSDESRFLLRPTDGRARVWRQRNTSFQDNHMLGTTAFVSKTLHQSYNDGMVNPEVVCHTYMAKTTVMHAKSLT
jgi:hypothetical protein